MASSALMLVRERRRNASLCKLSTTFLLSNCLFQKHRRVTNNHLSHIQAEITWNAGWLSSIMSRRTVVCGLILIVALHFYYQNYCQIVHNPFKPKDTNIVCHKHALSDNTKLTRILKTIFSRKEHLFSLRALGMRGVKVYWIGDHYLKDFEKPNLH